MKRTADVVICGAGIAGISAAYHLSVKRGVRHVLLVDERAPLTLTSDKSTECYRNWWPGPGDAMVRLMNRSIDLLQEIARETDNIIQMNRRGYLFVTANRARVGDFRHAAEEAAELGAGALRVHTSASNDYQPAQPHGSEDPLDGSDLLLDPALIAKHFPYLAENSVAVLHARRCGWFSAQQLGMYMLDRARAHGTQFVNAQVKSVRVSDNRVREVALSDGTTILTDNFVIAAGPLLPNAARLLGLELPVFNERHLKVTFADHLHAVARDAPLLIWTDPVRLQWSDEEQHLFAAYEETRWLLEE
ncbi:MAG: FAD-binding oxidoreductase, partial [Chloroflexi bacterium]|nr:FAD-binding oxidoreductase [Chloroflexota bacterium]